MSTGTLQTTLAQVLCGPEDRSLGLSSQNVGFLFPPFPIAACLGGFLLLFVGILHACAQAYERSRVLGEIVPNMYLLLYR